MAGLMRWPMVSYRLSMMVAMWAGTAVLVALLIWPTNKWVAMFLLLCLGSSFYPVWDFAQFMAFSSVLYGVLLFYVSSKLKLKTIMDAMCIMTVVNLAVMAGQYFGVQPPMHKGLSDGALCGLMANQNYMAGFLAITFPAFLRRTWIWLIPAMVVGLFMVKSVGGVASFAGGAFVYLVATGQYWSALVVPLLAGGALLYDSPGFERIVCWKVAIKESFNAPIFGHGLGSWKEFAKTATISNTRWENVHNDYIQAVFESGYGVLALVVGYVVGFLKTIREIDPRVAIGVGTVMGNAFVSAPFHIAPLAMVSIMWMSKITKE